MTPRLIVIGGPTAAGKSALALALAPLLNAEIINADSQQVYRGMDIGTGKPMPFEREAVPHHLYDVADPWEQLDAAWFVREADRCIAEVASRGKQPLIVGGTGLWMRALLRGLVDAPPADQAFRERLRAEAAEVGWPALHERLRAVDPESAARIHPTDPVRIERALEVFTLGGVKLSELHEQHRRQPPRYEAVSLGVGMSMAELEVRIARRVRGMFASGLADEVRALVSDPRAHERLERTMGYRETWQHLRGELALEEAIVATVKLQRQYAKRQRTWFKAESQWRWLTPEQLRDPASLASELA